jgi:hypothetical protein
VNFTRVVQQETAAMNTAPMPLTPSAGFERRFELRFRSLFNEGRALTFPCDAQGHVELDALSERARENYLYARAVVGREFATPAVLPSDLH